MDRNNGNMIDDLIENDSDIIHNMVTPREKDLFIENLSDDLLLENIFSQIDKVLLDGFSPTNFLDIFEKRYNYLYHKFSEDPDTIDVIMKIKEDIYKRVYDKIKEKFKIDFSLDGMSLNLSCSTINGIYQFFILNYKQNLLTFFTEYIQQEKKNLTEICTKKKNIDLNSFKKQYKNKIDAMVLANTFEIVDLIVDSEFEPNFIVETIIESDPYEFANFSVSNLLKKPENTLSDEFSERFFSIIKKKETKYTTIMNELLLRLLKEFPKKEKENE